MIIHVVTYRFNDSLYYIVYTPTLINLDVHLMQLMVTYPLSYNTFLMNCRHLLSRSYNSHNTLSLSVYFTRATPYILKQWNMNTLASIGNSLHVLIYLSARYSTWWSSSPSSGATLTIGSIVSTTTTLSPSWSCSHWPWWPASTWETRYIAGPLQSLRGPG